MNSGLFKLDFMVFSTRRTAPINMFVVEVKPPNGRYCGLLNDRTKLCFEMKIILDVMVSLEIKNPTATGLCVEGRTWTGYKMKLGHEAIYMTVQLFDFQLPSTTSDFSLLPKAIESMLMLKVKIFVWLSGVVNYTKSGCVIEQWNSDFSIIRLLLMKQLLALSKDPTILKILKILQWSSAWCTTNGA